MSNAINHIWCLYIIQIDVWYILWCVAFFYEEIQLKAVYYLQTQKKKKNYAVISGKQKRKVSHKQKKIWKYFYDYK